ncbi:type IV secretory pathway VirB10-like protein [Variovorax boronicumulans]|uniref:hypothetical protein n=1 Tax=Variovorax boronicumulans TaxID=436515 RepID=UPI002473C526|nr:hypothetical protein [Variovorax boronicumulans]MDH6170667.1 type IV secretory pathway VirB10-like protein [Variovorax boronicumulans]
MMGAPDANKGRPSLLGSSAPAAAASPAASNGESTRVLAQFDGRESGARSFIKRPGVWAVLALLIGVAGATTYQLQSKRADAPVNIAAAALAKAETSAEAAPAAPPKPEAPPPASAAAPATPEPATARVVEDNTPSPSQQQSTPFAAIGAQPMAVPPAAKPARVAAAKPPRTDKTTTAAAAKKPEHVASSKQPAHAARAADSKPVKTASNTSKTPRRANDTTQAASRPGKPDPDTDLLTALLRRSKAPDPAPQPSALAEVAADCKSGQRCKP